MKHVSPDDYIRIRDTTLSLENQIKETGIPLFFSAIRVSKIMGPFKSISDKKDCSTWPLCMEAAE